MIIKCENELIEIEEPISIKEGLKVQIEKSDVKDIIAARYNNEVVSLDKEINKDGKIEFINKQNRDGRYIYIRGALYIASKAISELYPKASGLIYFNANLNLLLYIEEGRNTIGSTSILSLSIIFIINILLLFTAFANSSLTSLPPFS